MSLYKTIIVNEHTHALIWKIEESYESLRQNSTLTEKDEVRLASMKSEVHRLGFLSIRRLLALAGYESAQLYYDDFGKPHLTNGKHISISHSFDFSAVVLSDAATGIDVEKQHDTVSRIAAKFIGYEWNYLTGFDGIEKLTVLWCIKESLYKAMGERGVSFKQHCKVIPFRLQDGKTQAWVHFKSKIEKYQVSFLSFEGYSCAYTLREPINHAYYF